MRITQLKYVLTIQKYRSISRAAEALFVTQPALSRAVSSLEKELGIALFQRTNKGIILTPAGEKLLPFFETAVQAVESAKKIIAEEYTQDIVASFCISASAILCNNILPDTVSLFNQSYPHIDIDVREEYETDIINAIFHNKADFGFFSTSSNTHADTIAMLNHNHLNYRLLLKSSLVAIVSTKSPLASYEVLTPQDLHSVPLILDKKAKPFMYAHTTQNVIFAHDREARTKMILKNQGYCVVPSLEMYNDYYIQEGLLTAIPYTDAALNDQTIELWLVYSKDTLEHYEQDFIDTFYSLLVNPNGRDE